MILILVLITVLFTTWFLYMNSLLKTYKTKCETLGKDLTNIQYRYDTLSEELEEEPNQYWYDITPIGAKVYRDTNKGQDILIKEFCDEDVAYAQREAEELVELLNHSI